MINNNVLEEFFVWEEKNLIDQSQSSLKNVEQDNSVTTTETKTNSTPKDWKDITDPKLRRKMSKKAWHEANKDKTRLREKLYREVNKEKYKNNRKIYELKNRDKINTHLRDRYKIDVNFKLKRLLRRRLSLSLDRFSKNGSAVRDLGCSIEEFKTYLESKFLPGMTWDNNGRYGWHIDHIKPLSSFDLSDRNQLLEACHYTNLQPLWAKDNLSKSDKISNN